MTIDNTERRELLALARESIDAALDLQALAPLLQRAFSPALLQRRSAFVTLRLHRDLRGCCGSIDAARPLAEEVWRNAWASAFADPRFPPLRHPEWREAHVHISVLEEPQPMSAPNEEALIRQLRPGLDGLILELGASRATFLPSVWEDLREPKVFVQHLKAKAGWSEEFWSSEIRVWRYAAESFGE
jgi:uncharacterized protein